MFDRLAEFVVRRRLWIVVVTGLFFLAAGAIGGGVSERLSSGGFEDPDAESTVAEEALRKEFGTQTPNVILLVTAESGNVDDPAVAEQGLALTEELARQEGVEANPEAVARSYSQAEATPKDKEEAYKGCMAALKRGPEE